MDRPKRPDPHQILISKAKDLSRDYIEGLSDGDAWALVYKLQPLPKPKSVQSVICFTGFTEAEKAPLRELAKSHGYKVVDKVVKSLTHLVKGLTPGEKKIQDATELKCNILTADEFERLLNQ